MSETPALRAAAPLARAVEWPTVAALAAQAAGWIALTLHAEALGPWLAAPALAVALAFHSSLQHEVAHGHPTRSRALNHALVFPPLGLAIPFERFRDLHMAHHRDERLTDPYEDPESAYLDPAVWDRLPRAAKAALAANNTLLGRTVLGPAISVTGFLRDEVRRLAGRERRLARGVARAWGLHAAGAIPVVAWLWWAGVPAEIYAAACYGALSLLKIRTFAEHRAAERPGERTAVVEDRGPLALLFLNNNLHAVHHAHPRAPWYALPRLYAAGREAVLARNGGYVSRSYWDVARRHLLRAKEPPAHPLMRR